MRLSFINYNSTSISVLIGLYGGLLLGKICDLKQAYNDCLKDYIYINKTNEIFESMDVLNYKIRVVIEFTQTLTSKLWVLISIILLGYISNYKNKQNIINVKHLILINNDKIAPSI